MSSIGFYCDAHSIESNAMEQLQQYAQKPDVQSICAFTDIHFCQEKALPVGVAFQTANLCYPLITGKDIGCGVMYLKIGKSHWLKPFDKQAHYQAFNFAHQQMTDDGLGGGNHFLSIEEDDEAVYIICHTGTRDRGIALYQHCLQLTRDYSAAIGSRVDYLHRDFLTEDFRRYYDSVLLFIEKVVPSLSPAKRRSFRCRCPGAVCWFEPSLLRLPVFHCFPVPMARVVDCPDFPPRNIGRPC